MFFRHMSLISPNASGDNVSLYPDSISTLRSCIKHVISREVCRLNNIIVQLNLRES